MADQLGPLESEDDENWEQDGPNQDEVKKVKVEQLGSLEVDPLEVDPLEADGITCCIPPSNPCCRPNQRRLRGRRPPKQDQVRKVKKVEQVDALEVDPLEPDDENWHYNGFNQDEKEKVKLFEQVDPLEAEDDENWDQDGPKQDEVKKVRKVEQPDRLEEADDWDWDGLNQREEVEKVKAPWDVVMDFDGTITCEDTIEALVCQAIMYNHWKIAGEEMELIDVASSEQGLAWKQCKDKYYADYSSWKRQYEKFNAVHEAKKMPESRGQGVQFTLDDLKSCTNSTFQLERADIINALRRQTVGSLQQVVEVEEMRKPMEEFSLERVNRSGIFKNIEPDALMNRAMAAEYVGGPNATPENPYSVSIKRGFSEFAEDIGSRKKSSWSVVSVNWSRDWIRGVLSKATTAYDTLALDPPPIMSNDTYPELGIIGPKLPSGISEQLNNRARKPQLLLSTLDKLKALTKVMDGLNRKRGGNGTSRPPRMYIGDSITDISCLLALDVGIVITENPEQCEALEALTSCGLAYKHINECNFLYRQEFTTAPDDEETGDTGNYVRLLWARDFKEILDSGMLDADWNRMKLVKDSMERAMDSPNKSANLLYQESDCTHAKCRVAVASTSH